MVDFLKSRRVIYLNFVLGDESGLCCNICREGYKFQPSKVLAIYTYTRPSTVDPFEAFAGAGGGPTPFQHHPSGTKDFLCTHTKSSLSFGHFHEN